MWWRFWRLCASQSAVAHIIQTGMLWRSLLLGILRVVQHQCQGVKAGCRAWACRGRYGCDQFVVATRCVRGRRMQPATC